MDTTPLSIAEAEINRLKAQQAQADTKPTPASCGYTPKELEGVTKSAVCDWVDFQD